MRARLKRILRSDGRALILAMDHAGWIGPVPGLEDPGRLLEDAIDAGVDAVLTTFGVVRRYDVLHERRVPTILRLDAGTSIYGEGIDDATSWSQHFTVEDALRLGADAVIAMGFLGLPAEADTLRILGRVSGDCARWDLPLVAEMLAFKSARIADPLAAEVAAAAARMGAEYGADLVKTPYTGDAASFRRVTATCQAPVLIAGGPRTASGRDTLNMVRGALDGGACGVFLGRNIWQYPQPGAMVRALARLIHDGTGVDQAARELPE